MILMDLIKMHHSIEWMVLSLGVSCKSLVLIFSMIFFLQNSVYKIPFICQGSGVCTWKKISLKMSLEALLSSSLISGFNTNSTHSVHSVALYMCLCALFVSNDPNTSCTKVLIVTSRNKNGD